MKHLKGSWPVWPWPRTGRGIARPPVRPARTTGTTVTASSSYFATSDMAPGQMHKDFGVPHGHPSQADLSAVVMAHGEPRHLVAGSPPRGRAGRRAPVSVDVLQ